MNFNYEVTITDLGSGLTGTVNFTGKLSGSARGTPRSISGSFSDYDVVPKSIQIGSTVYLVSIQPSFGPGATYDGVLLGNISVVPEPTSCLLLGLGVLGAGLGLRRFRRPIA
ncbi:MAG: PEP-CTERM sorting domain-containing protein [Isosphaeraceae bacterium]